MSLTMLYVPTDTKESAVLIAKTLVEEKVAVCVNITVPVTSIFTWEGKVEEANEVLMIIKVHSNTLEKARKRIAELHPYGIPCIAELELKSINANFDQWANTLLAGNL